MVLYNEEFDENNIKDVFSVVLKHKACVKESVFKKYFPKIYEEMNSVKYPDEFIFAQKLFHYLQGDTDFELGICKNPDCKNRTSFLGFKNGYRPYCSFVCMGGDSAFWDKHKETNLERYGVENPSKADCVKDRIKKTNLERYGVEHSGQADCVKDKIKKTKIERYGNPSYNNPDKIRGTWKNKGDISDIVERRENSYMEKTGYKNPFQNPDVISRIRQTNLEKYGDEIASRSDGVRMKLSLTKLGCDEDENRRINEKRFATNMERYGCGHVGMVDEFKKKMSESRKKTTMKRYPGVVENNNGRFVCCCSDPGCSLCDEKRFDIGKAVYMSRTKRNEELCTIKNPVNYSSSMEEKEFGDFIRSVYNGEIIFNCRKILDRKEIDIYLPDLKIGFEFNGVYYHSENYKEKNYHQDKALSARSKGISLVQIWEDDWFAKKEIVKDYIKSKLGLFDRRIGARKCEVREVSSKDAREFVNENHIQGYVNSSIRVGLYYGDELLMITTFGKMRKIMNSGSNGDEFELYRFCTKRGVQVVGGFQKLMKYFIDRYDPDRVITYASLDISCGDIYLKSGFSYVKTTGVGYSWANESTENKHMFNHRKHRYNFTKSELVRKGFDKNKTEDEIMHELGYFKCFDSGNLLFEIKKSR